MLQLIVANFMHESRCSITDLSPSRRRAPAPPCSSAVQEQAEEEGGHSYLRHHCRSLLVRATRAIVPMLLQPERAGCGCHAWWLVMKVCAVHQVVVLW